MKIYSMTATFGKLEHETLTLTPGLNVIHAPNEWGKSTWCAFLLAMLYGLDTRAKSTRAGLADKEHFAPWSGSPMSGRMELDWNGRRITIERTTRGRVPMGIFRAYETETGLEVPELNAANCGSVLLGIESSVFRRAGFIRLSDLPVTQDDALRRRLNELVTTGDESGDGARLEKSIRELKNRCRYNHSGLLPQAEQERENLRATVRELEALSAQQESLTARLEEKEAELQKLRNHAAALRYAAALRDAERVALADADRIAAEAAYEAALAACADLPSREETAAELSRLEEIQRQRHAFQVWQHGLPLPPEMPKVHRAFLGLEPDEAKQQVSEDMTRLRALTGLGQWILFLMAALAALGAGMLLWLGQPVFAACAGILGIALLAAGFLRMQAQKREKIALYRKYGSSNPEKWIKSVKNYERSLRAYEQAEEDYRRSREEEARRREALPEVGEDPEACREILRRWEYLDRTRRELTAAENRYEELKAMARPVPPPAEEDTLTYPREVTRELQQQTRDDLQRLQSQLGQCRGRMEVLGQPEALRRRLAAADDRIARLEEVNAALTLAQQTLAEATAQLQRRFAPRIAKKAQEIMLRLTGGRYDRLMLGSDLSVQAGTGEEDTLHDAQWRSEGTVDQLYLSLRLAVAEELTPDAPLILDDALVRFDDTRLDAAMQLLDELAADKQILLFSCQRREAEWANR